MTAVTVSRNRRARAGRTKRPKGSQHQDPLICKLIPQFNKKFNSPQSIMDNKLLAEPWARKFGNLIGLKKFLIQKKVIQFKMTSIVQKNF